MTGIKGIALLEASVGAEASNNAETVSASLNILVADTTGSHSATAYYVETTVLTTEPLFDYVCKNVTPDLGDPNIRYAQTLSGQNFTMGLQAKYYPVTTLLSDTNIIQPLDATQIVGTPDTIETDSTMNVSYVDNEPHFGRLWVHDPTT